MKLSQNPGKAQHLRPSRPWGRSIVTFALLAMPLGVVVAIAAESTAPASKPQAATTVASATTKTATTKEDPKAWKIAANWKLDILLSHPNVHFPSVLFPAPDGRIFLAED